MPLNERSILRVEGRDDKFVIENLLKRHGVDIADVDIKWSEADESAGGRDRLLQGMKTALITGTGHSIGFVLDADNTPKSRWQAVRDRLDDVDIALPGDTPVAGFVGDSGTYQTRVGIWLMPDNRRSGALEEFLMDLLANEDPLFQLAEASTRSAVERGAAFPGNHRRKAELHAWLAWQRRPGLPYGLAIAEHYFGHDSPSALGFVEWFKRVFGHGR